MSFQDNLRMYRERLGINAKDFAAQLGIKYTTYAGYETQGREPKYDILCKISAALNVSVDELIGHTERDLEYWRGYLMRLGLTTDISEDNVFIWRRNPNANDDDNMLGYFDYRDFVAIMEKIATTAEKKAHNTLRDCVEVDLQKEFNRQFFGRVNEYMKIIKPIKK